MLNPRLLKPAIGTPGIWNLLRAKLGSIDGILWEAFSLTIGRLPLLYSVDYEPFTIILPYSPAIHLLLNGRIMNLFNHSPSLFQQALSTMIRLTMNHQYLTPTDHPVVSQLYPGGPSSFQSGKQVGSTAAPCEV